MASDDRRSDDPADARSRFTTRTFLMPDDEPGDGASVEHDVPEEAFGTGGVDDDALDALVRGEGPAADVGATGEEADELVAGEPSALAAPLQTSDLDEARPFDLSEFDAADLEALSDDVIPEAVPADAFGFVDPPTRPSKPGPYEGPVSREQPAAEDAAPDETDPLAAPLADFDDAFEAPSALDEPSARAEPEDTRPAAPETPTPPTAEAPTSGDDDDGPRVTVHNVSEPAAEDEAADDLLPIEARLVEPAAPETASAEPDPEPIEPASAIPLSETEPAEPPSELEPPSEPAETKTGLELVDLDPEGVTASDTGAADPFAHTEFDSVSLDGDLLTAFVSQEPDDEDLEAEARVSAPSPAAEEDELITADLTADDILGEGADDLENETGPEAADDPASGPEVGDALLAVDTAEFEDEMSSVEAAYAAQPEPASEAEPTAEDEMAFVEAAQAAQPEAAVQAEPAAESEPVAGFDEPNADDPVAETQAASRPEDALAEEAPAVEAAEDEVAEDEAVVDGGALAEAVATAAVDGAFDAETDVAKADAVAGELDGTLDVAALGPEDFEPDDLRGVLRTMLLSRQLDKKMLTLLKQGKGFFHIGSAGHEASQTAVAREFEGGHDWFCFYYRDLATALTVGITPAEVLRAHFGKADDVFGGGRQMPEHFGKRALNIMSTSSSVAAQYLPAVGFALAVKREDGDAAEEGRSRAVYAAGGEGSTSQGAFHEALNWAAREALPVLFHIQDNKYAISVPVEEQTAGGSIWHLLGGYAGLERIRYDGTNFFQSAAAARAAMAHIRAGKGPVALHADLVRLLPHSSSDDHRKYREQEAIDADAARDPIPQFAARLVDAGVMTDDEVDALREEVAAEVDRIAREVAAEPDPDPAEATTHVVYEGDDARQYELDGETGDLVVMVDAINHAMAEEMERDDRVLVYGEDVGGGKGGVFTATRGLTERFGRGRCFNSPLAENSIIGSAVGLAAAGYKPVVEIQFADYIWPGMQPLRNQVASMRYRSKGEWACPMVLRVPCGGYIHGGLCHSQNVEALFAHFPGLQVVLPSNAADAKGLLKTAIRGEDPVLFLEHKALYRQGPARRPEPHADYLVPLGKAAVARPGTDLTIVTWGAIVYKALNAAKALEKEGVSVEVIDVRSILPFDAETVLRSVKKTGRVLIAYEDHEFMGFGAEIAAQIADDAFGHLDAPVKRVAGAFSSIPYADALEKVVLPQDDDVLDAARDLLSY